MAKWVCGTQAVVFVRDPDPARSKTEVGEMATWQNGRDAFYADDEDLIKSFSVSE
jgi:hypothetical protein